KHFAYKAVISGRTQEGKSPKMLRRHCFCRVSRSCNPFSERKLANCTTIVKPVTETNREAHKRRSGAEEMAKTVGLLTLAAVCFILSSAGLEADDDQFKRTNGKVDAEKFFKKLDANSDGKLSRDEFLKLADRVKETDRDKARDRLAKFYDKLDPQRRGLTKEQFKAFLEARKNGDKHTPQSN